MNIWATLSIGGWYLATGLVGATSPDVQTRLLWNGEASSVPVFRNGYLVVRDLDHLWVYSPDGRIWRPDGVWGVKGDRACVVPEDFDFDSLNILAVVSGTCVRHPGQKVWSADDVNFFNTADGRGKLEPSGFYLHAWRSLGVAFDEKHNLLLLGVPAQGELMLRQFREDGVETAAFLPRSQFPEADYWESDGERHIFLARDRIGVLLRHKAGGHEWVELNRAGVVLKRLVIDDPLISRFVFTLNGRLFAQRHSTQTSGGPVLAYDAAGVPRTILASDALLAGAEGDQLVFLSLQKGRAITLRSVDIGSE